MFSVWFLMCAEMKAIGFKSKPYELTFGIGHWRVIQAKAFERSVSRAAKTPFPSLIFYVFLSIPYPLFTMI